MAKKSPAKTDRRSSHDDLFRSAIEACDVAAVRKLIAQGCKPSGSAAEMAADFSNKAKNVLNLLCRQNSAATKRVKVEKEVLAGYEMTEAILVAGAPLPNALCSAACYANTKLALLLVKHGADVDYSPPMGTPLENAVSSGDLEIVRALIAAGADVNHHGYLGSVLTRAVGEGRLQVAEELIRAGAEVSTKPRFGQSPLMKAVEARRGAFVRLLLEAGADVNLKDGATVGTFGEPEVKQEGTLRITHVPNPEFLRNATPLIVAARLGYANIASQLISAKADVEALDSDGLAAMAYAVKAGDQAMIKLLSDAGARSLQYSEGSRDVAWIAAAKNGDCGRLQELMRDGADVNLKYSSTAQPEEGTALTHAAENGRVDAVKLLLKSGARVDEKCGSDGEDGKRTALMHAARGGHTDVVDVLIEAGAGVSAKDRNGVSPLHYAAQKGHAKVIHLLAKAGAKIEATDRSGSRPLMEAAGNGHFAATQVLLDLKADPNAATKDGFTALFSAASDGHKEVVGLLLERGASVQVANSDFSPLEAASTEGHKAIVNLLLKAQKTQNQRTGQSAAKPDGNALVNAALFGKSKIVRSLLDAGADANAVMDGGNFTALMAAVRAGNVEIVQMLLKAGAHANAMNEDHKTALDLAYEGIRIAKQQLGYFNRMGEGGKKVSDALEQLKEAGGEDELTTALRTVGGKRGKDLKGVRAPKPRKTEPEPEAGDFEDLPIPDFNKRARSADFQNAIKELAKTCDTRSKPISNYEGSPLRGCVSFRISTETADKILDEHHEPYLKRGFYLLKCERGYATGKDELALLPTDKRSEVFAAFQTNGANSGAYPADIVRWFDNLEKSQPFLLTGAGHDWCEGRFTRPIQDSKQLAKKMYEFCSDIVDQGVGDIARLALELKKTQKFFFWWD